MKEDRVSTKKAATVSASNSFLVKGYFSRAVDISTITCGAMVCIKTTKEKVYDRQVYFGERPEDGTAVSPKEPVFLLLEHIWAFRVLNLLEDLRRQDLIDY